MQIFLSKPQYSLDQAEVVSELDLLKKEVKTSRLTPLDNLRGLIIIFMALDHANFFIAHQHSGGEYYGFMQTYPSSFDGSLAFLTRFVTHFCAPGFFFLMGVGMVLFANSRRKKGWSEFEIAKHFWLRGLILIGLQLFIINRAWDLFPGGASFYPYFGVLYALGSAMILGTLLLRVPWKYLIPLGLLFMFVTEVNSYGSLGPDWNPDPNYTQALDFEQSPLVLLLVMAGGNYEIWVNYPVLAWMEVLIFGLIFGKLILENQERAYKRGLIIGTGFLIAFFGLRLLNGYGNTRPMAENTWIEFLNVVKYPPSITFNLLTIGACLIMLYGFSRLNEEQQQRIKPVTVFGHVALFVYIAHLFLYGIMGIILTPDGTSLFSMYPLWIVGLLILYPICKWYGEYKHASSPNSVVRYL